MLVSQFDGAYDFIETVFVGQLKIDSSDRDEKCLSLPHLVIAIDANETTPMPNEARKLSMLRYGRALLSGLKKMQHPQRFSYPFPFFGLFECVFLNLSAFWSRSITCLTKTGLRDEIVI